MTFESRHSPAYAVFSFLGFAGFPGQLSEQVSEILPHFATVFLVFEQLDFLFGASSYDG